MLFVLLNNASPVRARSRRLVLAFTVLLVAVSLLIALLPASSFAQVGHVPTRSPYEDFKPTQDLSLSLGRINPGNELAGVGIKPGFMGTLRYDLAIGGPASLSAGYSLIRSERNVYNPIKIASQRLIGTTATTTNVMDAGLMIALTGRKTWHRLVPSIGGGVGLASDFAKADTGGYKFGTKFAFHWGTSVRYVRHNATAFRFNITHYTWPYNYPDSYLLLSSDNTALINSRKKTKYSGNWAYTVGASYPIFR